MKQRYIRIELAPADMRRLEALTESCMGYVSPGHLASVAADVLAGKLRDIDDETPLLLDADDDATE